MEVALKMIQVDAGVAAILITILLSLIGMGVAWGTLREKVKQNRCDINTHFDDNKKDHDKMITKLDNIRDIISKGRKQ